MRRIAATIIAAFFLIGSPSAPPASAAPVVPVPPTVGSSFPAQADTHGKVELSVYGSELATVTKVIIGTVEVPAKSANYLAVRANLPAMKVGTYPVSVRLADGTVVTSKATVTYQDFNAEVLRLTNKARAAGQDCGKDKFGKRSALKSSSKLDTVAINHAVDMATRNYFSHNTKGSGKSPFDRMSAAGIKGGWRGENIAAGFFTPESVVKGWIKSHGHCVNMMNSHYKYIGLGYAYDPDSTYGTYWVQDFKS